MLALLKMLLMTQYWSLGKTLLKLCWIHWCKIWLFLKHLYPQKSPDPRAWTLWSPKNVVFICVRPAESFYYINKNHSTAWFVPPPQISHLQFASVTVQRVRLIEIWLKLFPKTPVRWLKRLRSLLSLRHWRIIVISILPFYHYFSYPDMTEMQGEFHRKQSPTLNLVYCSERNKSCSLESQLIRVQPGYVCILSRSWNGRNLSVTSQ